MSAPVTFTIPRRIVTLKPEQMELFAAEFYGTMVQVAGGDDEDYVIEFREAGDLAAFKLALDCFRL